MFEPYFTTKAAGVGTGLGMALVQSAITTLGAALRVESALGLGTTVHVYFAVQHPDAPEFLPTASELPRGREAPHLGDAPRILVVDDDEALRLMFERLLVRADFQVTTCAGAAEALVLMHANPCAYSLLVTDQNMLGQSGLQLAESFKQINDAVPIIITSGHLTEELSEKAMRLGVHALLPKEDAFEQLVGAVAMALHEASAESTSSEPRNRAAGAP
jgi:CheY-like chemotaxis protein